MLDCIVLGDDKRRPILAVFHTGKLVRICLCLDEVVNCLGVAVVRGIVKRRPLPMVKGVDVGSVVQQELNTLLRALLTSQVQGRAVLLILCLQVGSLCEKVVCHVGVVLLGCKVKRRLELVGKSINLSFVL